MMRWSGLFTTLASSTLYFTVCVYVFSKSVSPCPPGYAPPDCSDQCPAGSYGHSCLSRCPSTCYEPSCKADTGDCFRCRLGFSGAKCSYRCPRGQFGQDCGLQCPTNCKRAKCDSFTGFCHSCLTGFGGSTCETKLEIDLASARTRMQSGEGAEGGGGGSGGGKHRGGVSSSSSSSSSSSNNGGKYNRNKSKSGGDEQGYSYTYLVIILLAFAANVVLIALATCLGKSLLARFRRARSNIRTNRKGRSSSVKVKVKSSRKSRHYSGPFRLDNVHDPEIESGAFKESRDKKRLVYLGTSPRGMGQIETKIESLEELATFPEDDASRPSKDNEYALEGMDRQPSGTGECCGRRAGALMSHKSIDKECASGDIIAVYPDVTRYDEGSIREPNIPELARIRQENNCPVEVFQAAADINPDPLVQLSMNPFSSEGPGDEESPQEAPEGCAINGDVRAGGHTVNDATSDGDVSAHGTLVVRAPTQDRRKKKTRWLTMLKGMTSRMSLLHLVRDKGKRRSSSTDEQLRVLTPPDIRVEFRKNNLLDPTIPPACSQAASSVPVGGHDCSIEGSDIDGFPPSQPISDVGDDALTELSNERPQKVTDMGRGSEHTASTCWDNVDTEPIQHATLILDDRSEDVYRDTTEPLPHANIRDWKSKTARFAEFLFNAVFRSTSRRRMRSRNHQTDKERNHCIELSHLVSECRTLKSDTINYDPLVYNPSKCGVLECKHIQSTSIVFNPVGNNTLSVMNRDEQVQVGGDKVPLQADHRDGNELAFGENGIDWIGLPVCVNTPEFEIEASGCKDYERCVARFSSLMEDTTDSSRPRATESRQPSRHLSIREASVARCADLGVANLRDRGGHCVLVNGPFISVENCVGSPQSSRVKDEGVVSLVPNPETFVKAWGNEGIDTDRTEVTPAFIVDTRRGKTRSTRQRTSQCNESPATDGDVHNRVSRRSAYDSCGVQDTSRSRVVQLDPDTADTSSFVNESYRRRKVTSSGVQSRNDNLVEPSLASPPFHQRINSTPSSFSPVSSSLVCSSPQGKKKSMPIARAVPPVSLTPTENDAPRRYPEPRCETPCMSSIALTGAVVESMVTPPPVSFEETLSKAFLETIQDSEDSDDSLLSSSQSILNLDFPLDRVLSDKLRGPDKSFATVHGKIHVGQEESRQNHLGVKNQGCVDHPGIVRTSSTVVLTPKTHCPVTGATPLEQPKKYGSRLSKYSHTWDTVRSGAEESNNKNTGLRCPDNDGEAYNAKDDLQVSQAPIKPRFIDILLSDSEINQMGGPLSEVALKPHFDLGRKKSLQTEVCECKRESKESSEGVPLTQNNIKIDREGSHTRTSDLDITNGDSCCVQATTTHSAFDKAARSERDSCKRCPTTWLAAANITNFSNQVQLHDSRDRQSSETHKRGFQKTTTSAESSNTWGILRESDTTPLIDCRDEMSPSSQLHHTDQTVCLPKRQISESEQGVSILEEVLPPPSRKKLRISSTPVVYSDLESPGRYRYSEVVVVELQVLQIAVEKSSFTHAANSDVRDAVELCSGHDERANITDSFTTRCYNSGLSSNHDILDNRPGKISCERADVTNDRTKFVSVDCAKGVTNGVSHGILKSDAQSVPNPGYGRFTPPSIPKHRRPQIPEPSTDKINNSVSSAPMDAANQGYSDRSTLGLGGIHLGSQALPPFPRGRSNRNQKPALNPVEHIMRHTDLRPIELSFPRARTLKPSSQSVSLNPIQSTVMGTEQGNEPEEIQLTSPQDSSCKHHPDALCSNFSEKLEDITSSFVQRFNCTNKHPQTDAAVTMGMQSDPLHNRKLPSSNVHPRVDPQDCSTNYPVPSLLEETCLTQDLLSMSSSTAQENSRRESDVVPWQHCSANAASTAGQGENATSSGSRDDLTEPDISQTIWELSAESSNCSNLDDFQISTISSSRGSSVREGVKDKADTRIARKYSCGIQRSRSIVNIIRSQDFANAAQSSSCSSLFVGSGRRNILQGNTTFKDKHDRSRKEVNKKEQKRRKGCSNALRFDVERCRKSTKVNDKMFKLSQHKPETCRMRFESAGVFKALSSEKRRKSTSLPSNGTPGLPKLNSSELKTNKLQGCTNFRFAGTSNHKCKHKIQERDGQMVSQVPRRSKEIPSSQVKNASKFLMIKRDSKTVRTSTLIRAERDGETVHTSTLIKAERASETEHSSSRLSSLERTSTISHNSTRKGQFRSSTETCLCSFHSDFERGATGCIDIPDRVDQVADSCYARSDSFNICCTRSEATNSLRDRSQSGDTFHPRSESCFAKIDNTDNDSAKTYTVDGTLNVHSPKEGEIGSVYNRFRPSPNVSDFVKHYSPQSWSVEALEQFYDARDKSDCGHAHPSSWYSISSSVNSEKLQSSASSSSSTVEYYDVSGTDV